MSWVEGAVWFGLGVGLCYIVMDTIAANRELDATLARWQLEHDAFMARLAWRDRVAKRECAMVKRSND